MRSKHQDPALQLIRAKGIARGCELAQLGLTGKKLQLALNNGKVVRLSRGLYALPDRDLTEHDQLAQLAIKHPRLVFCLLTALQIHGITTQTPHEVWVAISPNARAPQVEYPPLRVVRFSDPHIGVEQIALDDVIHIPVTSAAKTIADCFKFRNKIGLDIALEALREAWGQKKVTMDQLWESAQICRVTNVIRPYLESLV